MARYPRGGGDRRRHRQQPAPKPFEFVPLPLRVNRKKPMGHHQYHIGHLTGQILGTIEAQSPLYIGSGIIDIDQNSDLIKTAVRTGGNIVIPGSSLKGAIRNVAEAISESCISKAALKNRRAIPRNFRECNQKDQLCVACRMFGAMGFQGKVAIQDSPKTHGTLTTKPIPELYRPRNQHSARDIPGRKFYKHGTVATGKTPVEACDIGTKFRFVVQVNNLTKAEWGLLFTAFGHHPAHPFKLKIGGAKPVCFGSIDIQIEKVQVEEQARERYLTWDVQPETEKIAERLETWKGTCISEATNTLIDQDLLAELAQILRQPKDRNCPSGLY